LKFYPSTVHSFDWCMVKMNRKRICDHSGVTLSPGQLGYSRVEMRFCDEYNFGYPSGREEVHVYISEEAYVFKILNTEYTNGPI